MWKVILGIFFLLPLSFTQANQICNKNKQSSISIDDFTIHDDNTVSDKQTGLMWKRCLEGQTGKSCQNDKAQSYTWSKAFEYAKKHKFAGYNDWRLPKQKELISIIEHQCYLPAINSTLFPNEQGSFVWSSSQLDNDMYQIWTIYFTYGVNIAKDKDYIFNVRLVRDLD